MTSQRQHKSLSHPAAVSGIAGAAGPAVRGGDRQATLPDAEARRRVAAHSSRLEREHRVTAADLAQRLDARRNGNGWMALCPAHDDHNPSLSITESDGGHVLVNCRAGCSQPAVIEALRSRGLWNGEPRELDPTEAARRARAQTPTATTTKAKKTHSTIDGAVRAAAWGLEKTTRQKWTETLRDVYRNAEGRDVAAVIRFDRADGATDALGKPIKTFRPVHAVADGWRTGDPPGKWPLFRLPELLASEGALFVNEGEKKSCAGAEIGLTCTSWPHGADGIGKADFSPLAGRDAILFPDNDAPGRKSMQGVAAILAALNPPARVRVVELPGLPPKGDLADFIALRPGRTPEHIREEIERLVSDAPAWEPPAREAPPELPCAESKTPLDPIEAARMGAPYAMTDLGNAERLVARHGDSIRWDTARGVWRVWDGRRWTVDSALRVYAMAATSARAIRSEAAKAPRGDRKRDMGQELFDWAVKSESRASLSAAIEVAKAQSGIATAADAWDVDPWALNVANGTIDLRTGVLRPHDRANLLTKLAPVEYRPGYRCERLERFLDDATGGDADLAAFLQITAGYTLTGDTSEEKLFIVYGPENSGKTTWLEMLRVAMGDYAVTIAADLLTKHKNMGSAGSPSPELARLNGIRFAAGSEMEQGRELAEALAKNLSGGEAITARHLHAEFFDFLPQFKLVLALNHCPRASADDGAIWRRILRIGFEHSVPPERRDKTLKPYLRSRKSGGIAVLAWAVEGCLRWQREGLRVPDAVARSTAAYRQESDPLAAFFEDCLHFNPSAWTTWADIWTAYNGHAEEMGIREAYRVAPKRLQDRLKAKECEPAKRFLGRGWTGVEIQDSWKPGDCGGNGGNGATSTLFSTRGTLRNEPEGAAIAAMPAMKPEPETPPAEVQSNFMEGYADDFR